MGLKQDLEDEMLRMYERAGKETGYWGNYFRRAVKNNGGLETAQKMLTQQSKTAPAKGLQALITAKRLDLSLETLVLQSKYQSLFSQEELNEAKRRLASFPDNYFYNGKNIYPTFSTWILQGNPKRFDMDDYLSRYSYIYWSASKYQKLFGVGDKIYIWRAGEEAGIVAYGILEELPTKLSEVKYPEALGADLWRNQNDMPTEIKVGIQVLDVRLDLSEGMLQRDLIKRNPILNKNLIITQPNNTVFKINNAENEEIERLWNKPENNDVGFDRDYSANEGTPQLKQHYQRERSSLLVKKKKEFFKKIHGDVYCELCNFSFSKNYPNILGENYIEAHHIIPLSKLSEKAKTTIEDLMLVCSNCHRMIHRTKDCESNLSLLQKHFRKNK